MFDNLYSHLGRNRSSLARSLSALLASISLFGGDVCAQAWIDQTIVLPSDLSDRLHSTQSFSAQPVNWNCLNVGLAEAMPSTRMIVPNDNSGDADRIRHMLRLGKDLFVNCVTSSGGSIQTDYDSGLLVGIEYRLWTANPVPQPSVSDTLGYRGAIYRDVGGGVLEFMGWMYCYDASGYTARLAAIAAFMGGTPLAQERVWIGELGQASDTGPVSMRIQGTRNEIFGDLWSQGTTRLLGSDNVVEDVIRWAASFVAGGSGNTYGAEEQDTTSMALRTPCNTEAHYLSLAIAAGQSYVGDILVEDDGLGGAQVNGIPVDGVIHTTGVIYVEGDDGIEDSLTLIGQAGVQFYGNGCKLAPAVDDLLVWVPGIGNPSSSEHNNARFEGRFNDLTGAVYAGMGDVEILTLGSTLYGRYTGSRIKVGGSENLISDGTN